jgi:S-adenosylmethionine-diacylglycerol 3-amino-3-carboxypropyl transferase
MAERRVLDAVKDQTSTSKVGILQRLFAYWFDAFVYNQIWEDPRVDLEALELDRDSRILTISSGGCNVLNYLIADPESITAVDLNRHHIALLELKLAAVKHLPSFEDFFEFFGTGKGPNTGSNYLRYIRPNLDQKTLNFWGSNTLGGSLIYGDRIAFFKDPGLYDHSRNGYFLKFFHRLSHLLGCKPEEVLRAESVEEQEELYSRYILPFFESALFKAIGKLPVTAFGLGIPPQQYQELKKELSGGRTVIDLYRDRVRKLACDFPIEENYFAWQAFSRTYDTRHRHAIPEYLKEENFARIRENAEKVKTMVGSVTDVIQNSPENSFNRFVFLDAQDWMNPDQIAGLWNAIVEKAPAGSRIIFRTAGSSSPVENALSPDLLSRFEYERERSAQLFAQDRASIYGGFHLYVVK